MNSQPSHFDVQAVKMMTGLPAFATQEQAEKALSGYLGNVTAKKVSLCTPSGQFVTAWVIQ